MEPPQVVSYPVLLTLLLGTYAIIPVQGSGCVTRTVTATIPTDTFGQEPCYQPNCPKEFICPNDGCRTAYITETVQVPNTWVQPVLPTSACHLLSCAPASTQAVTCWNQDDCHLTTTVTQGNYRDDIFEPCFEPNCPKEFICPHDGCRTATITQTVQVPNNWFEAVSPTSACYFQSCLPASTQAVTCENQGSGCVTRTVTATFPTDTFAREPCFEPNCPEEFICPQPGCKTAYITQTVQVPNAWGEVISPSSACYFKSCLPASTQAVTCRRN